ncbi:TPA: hypothetical protein QCY03_003493 [Bacillus tropicus]|nr:hypothetical protein [Bacillus tropicus]
MEEWGTIVEPYIKIQECDVLLLVGSAVLPWGELSEELDLVLINSSIDRELLALQATERLSEQERNGFQIIYKNTPDRELDIEVWSRSSVQKAIKNLGKGMPTLSEIETHFTTFGGLERKVGLDLFHYLFVGKSHPKTSMKFKELITEIDWIRYFSWNRDYHLTNVFDGIKGTRKSMREGFFEEAYIKLIWAFDNAVDGMIFHNGISINKWKWRLRYLDNIPKELAKAYREARFGGLPDSSIVIEEWLILLEKMLQFRETHPLLGEVVSDYS